VAKAWHEYYFVLWPKEAHPTIGRLLAYFEAEDSVHPKASSIICQA
jgi:hypothetical protein